VRNSRKERGLFLRHSRITICFEGTEIDGSVAKGTHYLRYDRIHRIGLCAEVVLDKQMYCVVYVEDSSIRLDLDGFESQIDRRKKGATASLLLWSRKPVYLRTIVWVRPRVFFHPVLDRVSIAYYSQQHTSTAHPRYLALVSYVQ